MRVEREVWGTTVSGEEAALFTMDDGNGLRLCVCEYGAAAVSLQVPDKNGEPGEVLLGYDDLEGYEADHIYCGFMVGRTAGRTADARFSLNGREYELDRNLGRHHLHGGEKGLSRRMWAGEPAVIGDMPGVVFEYASPHMESGYPGRLTVHVAYSLPGSGRVRIDVSAVSDRPTPVDITNHAYFNAAGFGDCTDHVLTLHSSAFLETDGDLIPTGRMLPVYGTPFDFTVPTRIGERIHDNDSNLKIAGGYDHYFILDRMGAELRPAAEVHDPVSGRTMELHTTQPGLQFYSGNCVPSGLRGRDNEEYHPRSGFCLEPQGYPDAVNHPEFPSSVLHPAMEYRQATEYVFRAE